MYSKLYVSLAPVPIVISPKVHCLTITRNRVLMVIKIRRTVK